MVVAVPVKIVPSVKKLLDFEVLRLWVADLVAVQNAGTTHQHVLVVSQVAHACLLGVSFHVIKLIDVNTISRVAYDLEHPRSLGCALIP